MPISLGAHVGQQNLEMDALRATWRRLDRAGLDWISAWDHFYEAPPAGGTLPHFEAVATLAALALSTERARLGCLVFYVGYRNPGQLAKAVTTIDHLSGGRFELGLGAGWHEEEATAYGYEFPALGQRLDMLEEAVPLIRSLLTNDRTTFEGHYFRAENASCLPHPVQARLPIWVGGTGERRTMRIAARHADGWNAAYITPSEYARLSGVLDNWCEKEGRDPATIRRTVNVIFLASADAAGAAAIDQQLDAQWGELADRVKGGAVMGLPEQVIEQVAAYVEAGAEGVNIALRAPWDDEALEAYLTDVVPANRAEFGAT
ncbi:MAG TPA: TIGR03560 family F420-dependent LLM class oxidoreductase [Acidimicrobiales bacterium]|nr:TIGR03560 family F420-dependent LLM class oxidoreductase [Acidimicrobiales bacterium]